MWSKNSHVPYIDGQFAHQQLVQVATNNKWTWVPDLCVVKIDFFFNYPGFNKRFVCVMDVRVHTYPYNLAIVENELWWCKFSGMGKFKLQLYTLMVRKLIFAPRHSRPHKKDFSSRMLYDRAWTPKS